MFTVSIQSQLHSEVLEVRISTDESGEEGNNSLNNLLKFLFSGHILTCIYGMFICKV